MITNGNSNLCADEPYTSRVSWIEVTLPVVSHARMCIRSRKTIPASDTTQRQWRSDYQHDQRDNKAKGANRAKRAKRAKGV